MKRIVLFIILSVLFAFNLRSEAMADSIAKANEAYTNQQYELAIDLYKSVVDAGYEAPELYFNLGNAYYKNNELAPAILYYEKAKKLDPSNEDVQFNLEIALSRTMDRIEAVPDIFYVRWWKQLRQKFTADTWAKIGIGSLFVFFILLGFYYFSKRIRLKKISFFAGVFVALIALAVFALAYSQYNYQASSKEAIVFTPSVTAKSSPDDNSTNLFVIHEGLKVIIQDKLDDWAEIRIADGSVGWIKSTDLKDI